MISDTPFPVQYTGKYYDVTPRHYLQAIPPKYLEKEPAADTTNNDEGRIETVTMDTESRTPCNINTPPFVETPITDTEDHQLNSCKICNSSEVLVD